MILAVVVINNLWKDQTTIFNSLGSAKIKGFSENALTHMALCGGADFLLVTS